MTTIDLARVPRADLENLYVDSRENEALNPVIGTGVATVVAGGCAVVDGMSGEGSTAAALLAAGVSGGVALAAGLAGNPTVSKVAAEAAKGAACNLATRTGLEWGMARAAQKRLEERAKKDGDAATSA